MSTPGTAGPTESTWCVYMARETGITSSSPYWSLRYVYG